MAAISPTATELRLRAIWIRDVLDPPIARDGPDTMHPTDVLILHTLFTRLQRCDVTRWALRFSRMHYAVAEVAGKATRWPSRLADECEKLVERWEGLYGPLRELRPVLYHSGGRLHGVCAPQDLTREALMRRWTAEKSLEMLNERAMVHGSLGFKPGQWWINGMFAFHAGIIDANSTDGGICADEDNAYAVVLNGSDEINATSATRLTYRCKPRDRGRYRLTSANWQSSYPIRVLRSHSQASLWAPRAGIRYEGFYRVTGWTIKPVRPAEHEGVSVLYEVKLEREPDQRPMDDVTKHPLAEEVDDYKEYKRLRRAQRDLLRQVAIGKLKAGPSRAGSRATRHEHTTTQEVAASRLDSMLPASIRRETHRSTNHLQTVFDGSADDTERRPTIPNLAEHADQATETAQSLFRSIDWCSPARAIPERRSTLGWQSQASKVVNEVLTPELARGIFAAESEQVATAGNAHSFLVALTQVYEDLKEAEYPDTVTEVGLPIIAFNGAGRRTPPRFLTPSTLPERALSPVEAVDTLAELSRMLANEQKKDLWQIGNISGIAACSIVVDAPASPWLEHSAVPEEHEQLNGTERGDIHDAVTLLSSMGFSSTIGSRRPVVGRRKAASF